MFRTLSYLVTAGLSILLFFLLLDFYQFKSSERARAIAKAESTTTDLVSDIDAILARVMREGEAFARELENNRYDKGTLESRIKKRALHNKNILGITVAYEPYAFDKNIRLYCPYFDKKKNDFIFIEDVYDYTDAGLATAQWYVNVKSRGAAWVEPYFAQGAQALVADYGVPFYFQGTDLGDLSAPKVKGTVTMTLSLKEFTNLIHTLSVGKASTGFVVSEEGLYIAHSDVSYIGKKNNVKTAQADVSFGLHAEEVYDAIESKTSGVIQYNDSISGKDAIFSFVKIPTTDWHVGVTFLNEDLSVNDQVFKRKMIHLAIVVSLFVFCLLGIIFNRDFLSSGEAWSLSLVASLVILINLVFIGYLQHHTPLRSDEKDSKPIVDLGSLDAYVENKLNTQVPESGPEISVVPSGIYVQRIEFKDSYNVNISGEVWQKYDNQLIDKVTMGFQFPQLSPFAESSYIEEVYREEMMNKTLVRYQFRSTLRLNFNYAEYPFDKRNIAIKIAPINPEDNLMLVPDLASYAYTNPSQLAGLDAGLYLPGSNILRSYFQFRDENVNARFGHNTSAFVGRHTFLYFNLDIKRVLLNSFITYLIPIFVSLTMMFILIYATVKPENKDASGGIIESMAAFFFVLVFSHIDLRKTIETPELMYMEYFYFIAYLMVSFSAFNLIAFTRKNIRLFDFQDNILMKTCFWPLFLILVLLVTLIKFY